ncbi:Wzz/FepE/Etk N-terminal domain-containing protein [Aeromonas jandaei]|uniref:Wzz/FepE/Etk N-terminal domain-containing protein n=1 Tax=Aeromonas jandaei TaxID=650 RepID=UPI003BA33E0F
MQKDGWTGSYQEQDYSLLELLSLFWGYRVTILVSMLASFIVGSLYLMFTESVWVANTTVKLPEANDIVVVTTRADLYKHYNFIGFPDANSLYNDFLMEFNYEVNKRKFLNEKLSDEEKLSLHVIKYWAQKIYSHHLDSKGLKTGVTLSLSFKNSGETVKLLNEYVSFLINKQRAKLVRDLEYRKLSQLE